MTVIRRDITALKTNAIQKINNIVSDVRKLYITVAPGQEMIYLAKEREAAAYIADPAPDLNNYPMLAAESGITAPDPLALANLWLQMSGQWRQVAAFLEGQRMLAITTVSDATTVSEINTAVSNLQDTLGSLQ
jgi:hypothetical protein